MTGEREADAALRTVVRAEWGRLVALLLARYRRLDLVEDALADAVEAAARRWGEQGVPDNPAAWLLTAARHRVLDRLRAEAMHRRRAPLLTTDAELREAAAVTMADPGQLVEDDLLRLVLMCGHPALAPEAACALSLRLVLGVPTPDIARLFLVSEPTMAARITRAKKKIVTAGIPFAVPDLDALPARLDTVASTAYLAFTAGYAPGSGPDLMRVELAGEAIRLVRAVLAVRPAEPVLLALLALTLLQHSRRDARLDKHGRLVLLPDQDRSLWRRDEIAEGLEVLAAFPADAPVTAQAASTWLQACIAGEHARAPTPEQTRWPRIVGHYDALLRLGDSPAARLARCVALAEAQGPEAGLAALADVDLPGSHRPPAVRAELLTRLGRSEAALAAYDEAIALCRNDVERDHLVSRRAGVRAAKKP